MDDVIKYKTVSHDTEIEEVIILRESRKSVYIKFILWNNKEREIQKLKKTKSAQYHDTLEEALLFLIARESHAMMEHNERMEHHKGIVSELNSRLSEVRK